MQESGQSLELLQVPTVDPDSGCLFVFTARKYIIKRCSVNKHNVYHRAVQTHWFQPGQAVSSCAESPFREQSALKPDVGGLILRSSQQPSF